MKNALMDAARLSRTEQREQVEVSLKQNLIDEQEIKTQSRTDQAAEQRRRSPGARQ